MMGALKFENKPLTIRWYLLTTCNTTDSEMKPFGIKWPQDPIKALGVFFSYDKKLLYLKNFSDKLDDIKKLINI